MRFFKGGGGSEVLFDKVLSAPASSFDTGVDGIPPGFLALECLFTGATDDTIAVTTGSTGFQLNGDTGANYYYESVADVGGGTNGSGSNVGGAADSLLRINMPGTLAGAGAVAIARCLFHNYDSTVFKKLALLEHILFDPVTKANERARVAGALWNNTAAINQIALVQGGGFSFVTGSRLTIIAHK